MNKQTRLSRWLLTAASNGLISLQNGLTAGLFVATIVVGVGMLSGCNIDFGQNKTGCQPQCGPGNQCLSDGCGGTCGCVDAGMLCGLTSTGGWTCEQAQDCTQPCPENWECGTVCGNNCGGDGTCDEGFQCVDGQCLADIQLNCDVSDPCNGRECGSFCGADCGTCSSNGANAVCSASGQCMCEPLECDGTRCDDGCGGICPCGEGTVCNAQGACVAPGDCKDTCLSAIWQCGELCGKECGPCEENGVCQSHQCECQSKCDGTRCDDGCGNACECAEGTQCNADGDCVENCDDTCESKGWKCGTVCGENCGTCEEGMSCVSGICYPANLTLKLVTSEFIEATETSPAVANAVIQIVYGPKNPSEASPRMADLRLMTDQIVDFTHFAVTLGASAVDKKLYEDPGSERPYRLRPDGSYQFLIYSTENIKTFVPGPILEIALSWNPSDTITGDELLRFNLVQRHETFAPLEADLALQDGAFDSPLVVTK